MYKVKLIRFFSVCVCLLCAGCDEIFLRFSHEKYICLDNNFSINEISVTKTSKNSKNIVLIDNTEFLFSVMKVSKDFITLENKNLDITLTIYKNKTKVSGFYKRNSFGIKCKKKSFRI
tara:strand:- start:1097 stop:1450 length:354 start_codon:yes stop_codon:yes gene_type:complete